MQQLAIDDVVAVAVTVTPRPRRVRAGVMPTWWCRNNLHDTCRDHGVGKGVVCGCSCHHGKQLILA